MRYCFVFEKSKEILCGIVGTVHCLELLIYITKSVCTKICSHQALVNLLHVSARRRCRHQGERNVGYVNWKDVGSFFN